MLSFIFINSWIVNKDKIKEEIMKIFKVVCIFRLF